MTATRASLGAAPQRKGRCEVASSDAVPGSSAARSGSNRDIEDAAVAFVIAHEQQAGRAARDTRGGGAAADLVSGDRTIEVKAYGASGRGQDLWLEVRQFDEAKQNPHFWLYIVDNVRQGDAADFGLVCLGAGELNSLLERARRRQYYEVPCPVATYDRLRTDGRQN